MHICICVYRRAGRKTEMLPATLLGLTLNGFTRQVTRPPNGVNEPFAFTPGASQEGRSGP